MIVADTNVISELMRAVPEPAVVNWVHGIADNLFVTTITIAETEYGIERLPDGRRKNTLRSDAHDVLESFADQVLPFDFRAAVHFGDLFAARERAGRPIAPFDAQIAAICRANRATLATRNIKDFEHIGIDLVDPWTHD